MVVHLKRKEIEIVRLALLWAMGETPNQKPTTEEYWEVFCKIDSI